MIFILDTVNIADMSMIHEVQTNVLNIVIYNSVNIVIGVRQGWFRYH